MKKAVVVLRYISAFILLSLTVAAVFFISACSDGDISEEIPETVDPSEMFFLALNEERGYSSEIGIQVLRAFYSDNPFPAFFTRMSREPTIYNMKMTASLSDTAIVGGTATAESVSRLLRDASIRISGRANPALRSSFTNAALFLSDQRLLGADILVDGGERFGARSDELYPDYVAIERPVLQEIIEDAAGSGSVGELSYDNVYDLVVKYLNFFGNMDVPPERSNAIFRPYIDKAKEVLPGECFTFTQNVGYQDLVGEGIVSDAEESVIKTPDDAVYTRIRADVTGNALRELLTALIHLAKDDTELHKLIYEKYTTVYDYMNELSGYGIDAGISASELPGPDSVVSIFQSLCTTSENLLGISRVQPVEYLTVDLYVEGTEVKAIKVRTGLDESARELRESLLKAAAPPVTQPMANQPAIAQSAANQPTAANQSAGAQSLTGQSTVSVSAPLVSQESVYIAAEAGAGTMGQAALPAAGISPVTDSSGIDSDFVVSFVGRTGESSEGLHGDIFSLSINERGMKPDTAVLTSVIDSDGMESARVSAVGTGTASGAGGGNSGRDGTGSSAANTVDGGVTASADGIFGTNRISLSFTGDRFSDVMPNIQFYYEHTSDSDNSFDLSIGEVAGSDAVPVVEISGRLDVTGSEGSHDFDFTVNMNKTPPVSAGGARTDTTRKDSVLSDTARTDKSPDLSVSLSGDITFGEADIPSFDTIPMQLLNQDSFYDGTFETLFQKFFDNVVQFYSANLELLQSYGFPGQL